MEKQHPTDPLLTSKPDLLIRHNAIQKIVIDFVGNFLFPNSPIIPTQMNISRLKIQAQ